MELLRTLKENPYFSAGFGLFGVGALAAVGRKVVTVGVVVFKRHYVTTLEVPCNDKSYQWMLEWITKRGATKTQHLSVRTTFDESLDSGNVRTHYDLIPSLGTHIFRHRLTGTWIMVDRVREQHQADIIGGAPWETLTLTTIGKQRQLFIEILEEARAEALKQYQGKTLTYSCGSGNDWRQFGQPKTKRPLESVILDKNVKEDLVKDVKEFIGRAEWYRRRGIPYRRGYLLHGPPGCGKTSLILALAGYFDYSICVLNLSDQGLSDTALAHRLAEVPENSLVLLEDVDAAFVSRSSAGTGPTAGGQAAPANETAFQGMNRLTFSGLLNAIDGVTSTEARILFMTTNYLDRLDSALIRPGRVDYTQEIGHCTEYQIRTLFQNFYPEASSEEARVFGQEIGKHSRKLSPAKLQGILMRHKDHYDTEELVKDVQKCLE